MKGILSLVITSLLYILFTNTAYAFKGIKMCQRDCEETKGCTGINYDPVHLECRLLFDSKKNADSTSSTVTKEVVKTSAMNNLLKACSANDRLIHTKLDKRVCVETGAKKKPEEYCRLLFFNLKTFQIDLKTHVVREFHFPWKAITCATYLRRANMFIISRGMELFTTPVKYMKKVSLRKNIRVVEIDSHEDEDIIFLKAFTKRNMCKMCTINLNGAHLNCFVGEDERVFYFAVDTNHKQVYIVRGRKLALYAYTGIMIQEIVQGISFVFAMAYNPVEDVLYYYRRHKINTVTRAGISRKVAYIKQLTTVISMKIRETFLYMLIKRNTLFVINIANLTDVRIIRLPYSEYRADAMCFF